MKIISLKTLLFSPSLPLNFRWLVCWCQQRKSSLNCYLNWPLTYFTDGFSSFSLMVPHPLLFLTLLPTIDISWYSGLGTIGAGTATPLGLKQFPSYPGFTVWSNGIQHPTIQIVPAPGLDTLLFSSPPYPTMTISILRNLPPHCCRLPSLPLQACSLLLCSVTHLKLSLFFFLKVISSMTHLQLKAWWNANLSSAPPLKASLLLHHDR